MTRPRPFASSVFVLLAVFLACFFFWPLLESLRGAFLTPNGDLTFEYFALLLDNPTYVEGFRNALLVAATTTAIASVLGVSMAVVIDRWNFPGKALLSALIPLPLIVPPFVGA